MSPSTMEVPGVMAPVLWEVWMVSTGILPVLSAKAVVMVKIPVIVSSNMIRTFILFHLLFIACVSAVPGDGVQFVPGHGCYFFVVVVVCWFCCCDSLQMFCSFVF